MVLVSGKAVAQNAHYFAWSGSGLQGTPCGNFGKTEAIQVTNRIVDAVGRTDEHHVDVFSRWAWCCGNVGGDRWRGSFVGVWEKFFH